jgi:TatD DNase family protein
MIILQGNPKGFKDSFINIRQKFQVSSKINVQYLMIDSHVHLKYYKDLDNILNISREYGITELLDICLYSKECLNPIDHHKNINNKEIKIHLSIGIHPNDCGAISIYEVSDYLENYSDKVIAFGETGVDLYYSKNKNEQIEFLNLHLYMSQKYRKTCIIHARNCDVIDILNEIKKYDVNFVFHCNTYNWEDSKKILDHNGFVSFSGIVTFKKSLDLQEVAKKVPFDRFLIETDSPYLTPEGYRGKENHPGLVIEVAKKIALLRGESLENIVVYSKNNFYKVFGK